MVSAVTKAAITLVTGAITILGATVPANAQPTGPSTTPQAEQASTGDLGVAQFRCGYYEQNASAYYGHCDEPPRTDVIIHVDMVWWLADYDMCVPPGVTRIDDAALVNNAWYVGRLC